MLQTLFEFIFGCRHRYLSRVFTIKHRTYPVCFDGSPSRALMRPRFLADDESKMPSTAHF